MTRPHNTEKYPDIVRGGRIERGYKHPEGSVAADKFHYDSERRPRTYQEATGRERPQKPPKYPLYDLEPGEGFLWLCPNVAGADVRTRSNMWVCARNLGIRIRSRSFEPGDGYHYIYFWRPTEDEEIKVGRPRHDEVMA